MEENKAEEDVPTKIVYGSDGEDECAVEEEGRVASDVPAIGCDRPGREPVDESVREHLLGKLAVEGRNGRIGDLQRPFLRKRPDLPPSGVSCS